MLGRQIKGQKNQTDPLPKVALFHLRNSSRKMWMGAWGFSKQAAELLAHIYAA